MIGWLAGWVRVSQHVVASQCWCHSVARGPERVGCRCDRCCAPGGDREEVDRLAAAGGGTGLGASVAEAPRAGAPTDEEAQHRRPRTPLHEGARAGVGPHPQGEEVRDRARSERCRPRSLRVSPEFRLAIWRCSFGAWSSSWMRRRRAPHRCRPHRTFEHRIDPE